jgi:hypothetical protein
VVINTNRADTLTNFCNRYSPQSIARRTDKRQDLRVRLGFIYQRQLVIGEIRQSAQTSLRHTLLQKTLRMGWYQVLH